jgi:hypothetical protein
MDFKRDHIYNINYTTNGYHSCAESGCDDEGICRCYTIESIDIHDIRINAIANSIYNSIFDTKSKQYQRDMSINSILFGYSKEMSSLIDIYCIDRILRVNKLYDTDLWESTWGGNYYGDEVYTIDITNTTYNNISNDLDTLFSLSSFKEKIQFLLQREYGHILDSIKDKEYDIKIINKSDIHFPQDSYHKKIEIENFYLDKNYQSIRGICQFDGEKYRVIDGYHRLTATNEEKIKIISIC